VVAERRPVHAKICGLARPIDAEAAVRLGARWLGVIFAGGPREVTPERAREVVSAAGDVPVIGVFATTDADAILRTRDAAGLAGAQLHGGAPPALVERLRAEGVEVITVARLAAPGELEGLDPLRRLGAPVLVEPRVPAGLGGTGAALSLELAEGARNQLGDHFMFLAGGLTPESVGAAIRAARPDAVDVSSGVEQIPGIKDHSRMARFMEAVQWA
jgi:phosphoribosylanthranilate isomerase